MCPRLVLLCIRFFFFSSHTAKAAGDTLQFYKRVYPAGSQHRKSADNDGNEVCRVVNYLKFSCEVN